MPKSFMTPRRGQLAALSVASLLSLAKLAADGYMVSALGVLLKKYRDIEDCMGDDCPVPTWFTPQSNDDIQKEWSASSAEAADLRTTCEPARELSQLLAYATACQHCVLCAHARVPPFMVRPSSSLAD